MKNNEYILNTGLPAPGAPNHRLQRLENPKWPLGAQKWLTGSGKVLISRFMGAPFNFR